MAKLYQAPLSVMFPACVRLLPRSIFKLLYYNLCINPYNSIPVHNVTSTNLYNSRPRQANQSTAPCSSPRSLPLPSPSPTSHPLKTFPFPPLVIPSTLLTASLPLSTSASNRVFTAANSSACTRVVWCAVVISGSSMDGCFRFPFWDEVYDESVSDSEEEERGAMSCPEARSWRLRPLMRRVLRAVSAVKQIRERGRKGEAKGGVPSSVRLIVKSEAFEISRSAI